MEKKKNKHFIIPPSYFKAKGITPIPVKKPSAEVQPSKIQTSEIKEYTKAPTKVNTS